jgi:FMN phosphatase YigB (HAD superfamily)
MTFEMLMPAERCVHLKDKVRYFAAKVHRIPGRDGNGIASTTWGAPEMSSIEVWGAPEMSSIEVIFFDIGDTLAVARLNNAGRLVSLEPLPGVLDKLRRLQDAGYRLGIISNTGEETTATMRQALTMAGFYRFFEADPALLIYSSEVHLTKNSPQIFRLACERAKVPPEQCMFVGEDERERDCAIEAGLQVAASPDAVH